MPVDGKKTHPQPHRVQLGVDWISTTLVVQCALSQLKMPRHFSSHVCLWSSNNATGKLPLSLFPLLFRKAMFVHCFLCFLEKQCLAMATKSLIYPPWLQDDTNLLRFNNNLLFRTWAGQTLPINGVVSVIGNMSPTIEENIVIANIIVTPGIGTSFIKKANSTKMATSTHHKFFKAKNFMYWG